MATTDYTTWGGDEAQRRRRASMQLAEERPSYWLELAWRGIHLGMTGRGNVPEREFANAIDAAVKALEMGAPAGDLDLAAGHDAGRGLPDVTEPGLLATWRAIIAAVQTEALARYAALSNSAAMDEAQASMEISPV